MFVVRGTFVLIIGPSSFLSCAGLHYTVHGPARGLVVSASASVLVGRECRPGLTKTL